MNQFDARGQDYDAAFSTVQFYKGGISSACHKAIKLTTAKFSEGYPGWPLYSRLVTGDDLFDRRLMAYAVGMARALARSRTATGRAYIGQATRGLWIKQAGLDGLHYAIFGTFPVGLHERAAEFDVANKTYQKVRDPVGGGIRTGIEMWRSELHANFTQLILSQKYPGIELDVV